MLSPFVSHKLGAFLARPHRKDLLILKELIESEKVAPVIGKTYPLRDVPNAMRDLEGGHAQGKVVISMGTL
jgi:NADPH:quinone reductase-like Zn-dependent oxidoreductase